MPCHAMPCHIGGIFQKNMQQHEVARLLTDFSYSENVLFHHTVLRATDSPDDAKEWNGFMYARHPRLRTPIQTVLQSWPGDKTGARHALFEKFVHQHMERLRTSLRHRHAQSYSWSSWATGFDSFLVEPEKDAALPPGFGHGRDCLYVYKDGFNTEKLTLTDGGRQILVIDLHALNAQLPLALKELMETRKVVVFDTRMNLLPLLRIHGVTPLFFEDLRRNATIKLGGAHWNLKSLLEYLTGYKFVGFRSDLDWVRDSSADTHRLANVVAMSICRYKLRNIQTTKPPWMPWNQYVVPPSQ